MVIGNVCTEIGDVLLFSTQYRITDVTQLLSYTDNVGGVTASRYFDKQFRYSFNGVTYSNWLELSNQNLQSVIPVLNAELFLDFLYTRDGTDNTGLLTFVSLYVAGNIIQSVVDFPDIDSSIFKDIFYNNPELQDLTINLTQKLYGYDIVPGYFTRQQDDGNPLQDADYISFWKTVANFYSLFFIFAKQFTNIYVKQDLLFDYLSQKGYFLCQYQQLPDIQYIANKTYDLFRKRGTAMVFKPNGTIMPSGDVTQTNGEFLNLICYNPATDEYLFNVLNDKYIGWNIGNSSPSYRGTRAQAMLNKTPENTQNFTALSDFYLTSSSYISLYSFLSNDNLRIAGVPNNVKSGIGLDNNVGLENYLLTISPNLSYEISFWIAFDNISTNNFSLKVWLYDQYGNQLSSINNLTNAVTQYFLKNQALLQANTYYFVSAILYATGDSNNICIPSINAGNNLIMPTNTCKMYVGLGIENNTGGTSGSMYIWNFKIRPQKTNYSTCFLNTKNLIEIWAKDNAQNRSLNQINDLVRRYLIPYNSNFTITQI